MKTCYSSLLWRWRIPKIVTSNLKEIAPWFFPFSSLGVDRSFVCPKNDEQHRKLNHHLVVCFCFVCFCMTSCSTSNSASWNWSGSIRSNWCWRRSSSLSRRNAPTWREVTIRLLPLSSQTLKSVFENYSKSTTKWPPDSAFLLQSTLKHWLVVIIIIFFSPETSIELCVLDTYFWVSCYCCWCYGLVLCLV